MASLRNPTAARLLRSATVQGGRSMAAPSMATRRFQSNGSNGDGHSPSGWSRDVGQLERAKPMTPAHKAKDPNQPDYGVHIDKATSTFTPVPKRVLDGSEDSVVLPAAVLSGAPMELQARTVRIYKPTKPATQSGDWHSHRWRMDWDVLPKGHRWENPLIGWQSSGDFMQGTRVNFRTREDAIRFAEKQGYEYFVQEPNERRFTPKAYANNFLYSPKKLKTIRTK